MGTFGYPVSWCMMEDEKSCLSAGWKPYHVRKGYNLNDNTITLSSTLLWGNNMAPATTDPEKIMELMAWDISERCQFALGSGKQFTNRTILITPEVADNLAKKYRTPEALEYTLIEKSRRPLKERNFANYYANPGSAFNPSRHSLEQHAARIANTEGAQMTATPEWYDTKAKQMLTIPTMKEGMTAFIVTGDAARNKVQIMPGGGCATVKIELPHNWDQLMEQAGYEPLSKFQIGRR